jgi:hypothetical protein
MRYIDRRFLLPVAAATTAWAQQQSPEAAAAEVELRARVDQFFQLQVDKKYRQAESLVADDSKDAYYDGNKYNIRSFSVQKIELLDGNTRSRVTIKAKVTVIAAAAGPMEFDVPATSLWKLESGEWVYYINQEPVVQTPFGKIDAVGVGVSTPTPGEQGKAPDPVTLQSLVSVDTNSVALTEAAPGSEVTISNDFPGAVDLALTGDHLEGFSVEFEKKHLEAGEKTRVRFKASEGVVPKSQVVRIIASPLNRQLDIQVNR